MTKWEYVVDSMVVSDMASRGRDGWELTAVHDGMAFFKRELVEAPAPAPAATVAHTTAAPASTLTWTAGPEPVVVTEPAPAA